MRLFKSTAKSVRVDDFVVASVVNGSTHGARWRGVVESITHTGGRVDIYLAGRLPVTLFANDTVWIERKYV